MTNNECTVKWITYLEFFMHPFMIMHNILMSCYTQHSFLGNDKGFEFLTQHFIWIFTTT